MDANFLMNELQVLVIEPRVDRNLPNDEMESRNLNAVDFWNFEF
jgi:hypothetical protein